MAPLKQCPCHIISGTRQNEGHVELQTVIHKYLQKVNAQGIQGLALYFASKI